MADETLYESRFTGEEIDNALAIAAAIGKVRGVPMGTGQGTVLILSLDAAVSPSSENIPTSAAVYKAIAAARTVTQLLTFRGKVTAYADLPADAAVGDVYLVEALGENYAWDGVSWVSAGKLLSPAVESVNGQKGVIVLGATDVGAAASVCGETPDESGNIPLAASNVGALPSAGGDMTGPINMNGQTITGLNDPTADTDAARKGYVDAMFSVKTATLTASGWSSSAPYTQTVSVAGVVAGKPPHVAPVYSGGTDADIALKEAGAAVTYATPGAGKITFVCLEDKPGVDIPIQVEVRR